MFESRGFNLFMAFACHQLLIAAFYFQYVEGMEPCPFCIFQRIAVLAIGIWFLLHGIHKPLAGSRWNAFYNIAGLFSAVVGTVISARHAYLQSLPAGEVPACGPSLDYLVDMLPIMDVLEVVFKGSGSCAEVSWRMLGLSMPVWLMLFFVGCIGLLSWRLYRYFRPNNNIF